MKPLYIFDLDGTLADCSHRVHFITECDPKDWTAFFAASEGDSPIRPVIEILKSLRYHGKEVWIWTGRSDEAREATEAWLSDYVGPGLVMRMRVAGDHTHDDVLKASWLDEMQPEDRRRLWGVFEDRARVVAMWRANGVRCFQVEAGEF